MFGVVVPYDYEAIMLDSPPFVLGFTGRSNVRCCCCTLRV